MTEQLEQVLKQAMANAYDNPRQVPDLAERVAALDDKRRRRQRVGAAVAASLVVALLICVPLLVRGTSHGVGPSEPVPASTSVVPAPSTPAASSSSFGELQGWWRFTHLQAPGGSVPILRGMPAYLHFDSPTVAAAEIGNNTTTFDLALEGRFLDWSRGPTSAVSSAFGENAVEYYLDHLAGVSMAVVTGDGLEITGPDGSVADLVRTPEPASPAAWSCCEPTAEPPVAVAPDNLPACSVRDLTGSFYVGYRSPYGDYNEVLLRSTAASPCVLRGPLSLSYLSVSGPVSPLHQDQQQAPMDAIVLSPTALTAAQDANQAWTSAVTVPVYSASSGERTPQTPCAAAEQQHVTSVLITVDVGTVRVDIPNGLTTCENQLRSGGGVATR